MNQHQQWHQEAELRGWTMPAAPRWKRLPGVRHVRALVAALRADLRNAPGPSMGYDDWIVAGIASGEEVDG